MEERAELSQKIENYIINEYSGVMSSNNIKKIIDVHLRGEEYELLYLILDHIMRHFHKEWGQVLDLGCGLGELTNIFANHKVNIIGVEPDENAIRIAKLRGLGHSLVRAVGEYLPLRDELVGTVISISTLEHVSDSKKVINEALRVLKSRGICLLYCPDYSSSFYEEHYKMFWLPFLTKAKSFAHFYLRIRGRKTNYIIGINYITREKIKKAIGKHEYFDLTTLIAKTNFILKRQKLTLYIRFRIWLNKLGRIWLMIIKT